MVLGINEYLNQVAFSEVIRIKKPVNSKFEASAIIKKVQETGNGIVYFEKIAGYGFPLVSNVLGSRERIAQIMSATKEGLNQRWLEAEANLDSYAPLEDELGNYPYRECKLLDVPALIYCEKDAGHYFSACMVCVQDPDNGSYNLSFHRMQIVSDDKIRLRITPGNHLETYLQRAEQKNQTLPVSIILGGHPALMLAGASRIPLDKCEVSLAGSLLGEKITMAKCATVEAKAPIGADFIIEAEFLPHTKEDEAPFGDFFGYYVPVVKSPVVKINKVHRLQNACAYGILAGSVEQDIMSSLTVSAGIYQAVKKAIPNIKAVNCLPKLYHSVIQMTEEYPGQGQQAAMLALACDPSQTKICTVVDEDVDIFDERDVYWAILTRSRLDRDITVIPNWRSFRRDAHSVFTSKMAIIALKPAEDEEGKSEYTRTAIPGYENIDVRDYL